MPYQAMSRIHYKTHEEARPASLSLTTSPSISHGLLPILTSSHITLLLPFPFHQRNSPSSLSPSPASLLPPLLPVPLLIRPSRLPRSRTPRAVHILRPRMLRNLDAKTLMPGIVPCKVAVAQALGDDVAAFRVLEVFVVAHVD